MLLNDMDDRKKLAYLLSLSRPRYQRYIVEHPRPNLKFIGMAIFIGLILVLAYLWQ